MKERVTAEASASLQSVLMGMLILASVLGCGECGGCSEPEPEPPPPTAQEQRDTPARPTNASGTLTAPSGKWTVRMQVGGEPKTKPAAIKPQR